MLPSLRVCVAASQTLSIPTRANLERLNLIECIVVVGSSGAGKSTLVKAIRTAITGTPSRLEVPSRYVTRPARPDDCTHDNLAISAEEFDKKVCSGTIGLHWVRPMENQREERYGFPPVAAGRIAVYSANNALFTNMASVRPADVLDHAFVLGVYAPETVRNERLSHRSPDLCRERPDEIAYRLTDDVAAILSQVHVVVANYGTDEATALCEVVALVQLIGSQCEESPPIQPPEEGESMSRMD